MPDFFYNKQKQKSKLNALFEVKFTVVQLSFSLHQSILSEQYLHHELMLEFDLNIELDLINDVEFHQKIL